MLCARNKNVPCKQDNFFFIFYQISTKIYFFAKFSIDFKLRAYSSCDGHKQCYQHTAHVYSIILAFLTWDMKVTKAIASSTSHNMGSSSSCLHIPNASASSCCRTSKWSNTYSNSQETCHQFSIVAGHLWAGFTVMRNSFSSIPLPFKIPIQCESYFHHAVVKK